MSAPLLVSLFSLGLLVKFSSGFSNNPKVCFLSIKHQPQQLKQRSPLFGSPLEDYDQWVEQLDPSVFEEDDTEEYDASPRSRGTGTRRHQGRQHEEYERDYDADNSRVDEDAINQLIAERSRARRQRQFEEADAIRDELLEQHGVRLLDREKVWRSGCSSSGSGKQWGRNGNRDATGRGGGREQGRERGPRRPVQDFGPNGHDYLPSPDQGPHASVLAIPEIHDLLAERLECKLSRNFRRADAIQNELFENGVYVHDGFKEWRSDGSPFPGGADRRGKPQSDPLARTDRRRIDPYQPYEISEYSQPLLDVDSNEDDDLAQEAAQALQDRIQELVDERAEAKRVRDYRTADLIRDELRMDYGVEIDDNRRVWSKGGLFDEPPGPYKMSPYSLPLSSLLQEDEEGSSEEQHSTLLQTIEDLVEERSQAKGVRDYERADDIRDTLSGQYNVLVNDRLRQWSIGGQFEPPPEPYTMLEDSEVPETIDVETINEKLMDRDMARRQKAFQIADDILSELSDDHGIAVDDKSREWWYGIQPESRDAFTGSSTTVSQYYKKRGGGDVSEEDTLTITEMLQERLECKRNKEFGRADRIRDRLQNEFGCRVDDKNMEWHIVTSAYVQGSSPADMDEATATYIQEQVDKRAVAKLKRDYELADTIRDTLMDEYNVRIDDRVKEWNVLSVRPSRVPQDDEYEYDEEDDDDYDDDDDEQNVPEAVDSNASASTVEETEAPDDTTNLEGLTVVALKEKLRAKNLPVSGKKAELIERLISG